MREEQNHYVQVESFLEGREYAVEGVLSRGRLQTLAVFEKPDPLDGPFFEETLYITPPRGDAAAPLIVFYHGELEKTQKKVVDLGGKIAKEIFDFPGGRRFHFQEPGGGEFAVWSDK